MCVRDQSCLILCDPIDCSLQAPHPRHFSGKNTGEGCHFLLQGIFPTQGQNPCRLHCRWILYSLSHQGSSFIISMMIPKTIISMKIQRTRQNCYHLYIGLSEEQKFLTLNYCQSSIQYVVNKPLIPKNLTAPCFASELLRAI